MSENRLDLALAQEQVDKVLAGLEASEDSLPGLIELTPEQRKGMGRYSERAWASSSRPWTSRSTPKSFRPASSSTP